MTIITKPRLIGAALAVAVVAGLNRTEPGRKLLGTESDDSWIPFL